MGLETWIVGASGAKQLIVPTDRKIIICMGDGDRFSPGRRAIDRAIRKWRWAGTDIVMAFPWPKRCKDNSTFADAFEHNGAEYVTMRIGPAISRAIADNLAAAMLMHWPRTPARRWSEPRMQVGWWASRSEGKPIATEAEAADAPPPVGASVETEIAALPDLDLDDLRRR